MYKNNYEYNYISQMPSLLRLIKSAVRGLNKMLLEQKHTCNFIQIFLRMSSSERIDSLSVQEN